MSRRVLDADGAHDSRRLDLVECCLSCTIRADVPQALALASGLGRWFKAVLALPAAVQPRGIAQTLSGGGVRLDTVTVVVDAVLLVSHLGGHEPLSARGLAAAPSDTRSTSELLAHQLEDADVLAICGLDRLAIGDARRAQALLAHLAPLALQVPNALDGTGARAVVSTGRSDPASTAQEREQLAAPAAELCPPSCGVQTVLWEADGALDLERLDALDGLMDAVVRSRGTVALADRPGGAFRWESARRALRLGVSVPDAGAPLPAPPDRGRTAARPAVCCA